MTAASDPSKLQKEEVEIQEGAASLAVAKETSADVAVGAVVSELDSIFTLKDRKRTALKAFLRGHVLALLLLTGFGERSVKHYGTYWLATG